MDAAALDLHPQDDHSHRFFIWHEWIQANGPLTQHNVLDYFATSMFWDTQSNNQVIRMQHTGTALVNEAEDLKRFTGLEFGLVHARPPSLFVIHKRERLSPDEVRPLAAYFILHNRIYQSPDVYSVISNRLLTTLHSLQASLEIVRSHRPDFTPRAGFIWPIVDASQQASSAAATAPRTEAGTSDAARDAVVDPGETPRRPSDDSAPAPPRERDSSLAATALHLPKTSQKTVNTHPLFLAMSTTAAHSKATFVAPVLLDRPDPSSMDVVAEPQSATPASPVPIALPTPNAIGTAPTRGPPGGGKKKRRRTGIHAVSTTGR